jgi:hypothetical protein
VPKIATRARLIVNEQDLATCTQVLIRRRQSGETGAYH